MAKRLRALGVSTLALSKVYQGVPTSEKDECSFKGKEKGKGMYAEVVRVKIGEPGESLWVHLGE